MVPEGWRRRLFGEFCTQFKRLNLAGEDLPPLSVTKNNGIVLQSDKFKKRIAIKDTQKYKKISGGEFAYDPMSLYYGAIGRYQLSREGLLSPAYITFSIDDTVSPEFFWALVKSRPIHREINFRTEGGNIDGKRKKTDWQAFSSIEVPFPPLPEQKKIAAILGSVDEAIQATQAVIDQTRKVKQGLLQQLLTRGIGHTRFKQTEIGEIPEGWEVVLLDSVAKRGTGHTPTKKHPEYWYGGIKWVSLQDSKVLDRLYIYETAAEISQEGINNSSAVLHPEGTVVLSRDAGVGKSAITADEMAVSQHFIAWVCGPQLNNHFLYYWLQYLKPTFERIAIGSTIKTIGMPYFKSMKVPVPPRDEQDRIQEILVEFDRRIFDGEHEAHRLKVVKKGLMQDLLTGRVRVGEAEGVKAAV